MEHNEDAKDTLERFAGMVDSVSAQLNLIFSMAVLIRKHPGINEIDVYKQLDKIIKCINTSKETLGLNSTCKCKNPQILN